MTILTSGGEKKNVEVTVVPLVAENDKNKSKEFSSIHVLRQDCEFRPPRPQPWAMTKIFAIALIIMSLGILGGNFLARHLARSHVDRMRFHGFCGVPYESGLVDNKTMMMFNSKFRFTDDDLPLISRAMSLFGNNQPLSERIDDFRYDIEEEEKLAQKFLKEELELDLSDDESYARIDVPDFKNGRPGRFLHDFKFNQSGIIDAENRRCFIMPLDREVVLPPKSMRDLVVRIWNGYYDIDTTVIRKEMRVVIPEIEDVSTVAPTIYNECRNMKIFRLEKIEHNIEKRSAELDSQDTYVEFTGKLSQVRLHNLDEVNNYMQAVN
ncbi:integral membrane protein 2B [Phlebotomus argentipes]|uniref:integral membrane protein 2B n=1 Tax=Phlebotomus argentipes TaxID=94469 RepID=UPI002892DAF1|nr:integral membrane protein 2B [Phlebotomus argentipes]